MSDFDFLDSFEGDYKAQHAFTPGLDTVPAGDYDCEFLNAIMDEIGAKAVVRCALSMNGRTVERLYWLDQQRGVNELCADLAILGFGAEKWGTLRNGPPLKTMIPATVVRLRGVKFRATKTTEPDKKNPANGPYHKLYIAGRTSGATAPSPAPVAAPAVPTGGPAADPYDIPF